MWSVDDDLIEGIQQGDETYLTRVVVGREDPYYDIDLVGDLRLERDESPGPLSGERKSVAEGAEHFRRLREPLVPKGSPSHLLINCGDMIVDPPTDGAVDDLWLPLFEELQRDTAQFLSIPGNQDVRTPDGAPYYETFLPKHLRNVSSDCKTFPVASMAQVWMREEGREDALSAYVVAIGFDSNSAFYQNGATTDVGQVDTAQLDQARALIRAMAKSLAATAPLYVIAVTHHGLLPVEDQTASAPSAAGDTPTPGGSGGPGRGITAHFPGLLHHCQQSRVALVVHANMHERAVHTLSVAPIASGRNAGEINLIACPSFEPRAGRKNSGLAHIRINVWRGEAEIGYVYDDPDAEGMRKQAQVVRPILSASRISGAEQRLHTAVKRLLADARAAGLPQQTREDVDSFDRYMDDTWSEFGYVPLTLRDGSFPDLPAIRKVRYNLLVLLRRRETGSSDYEMLLSHHTPLRPPRLADWTSMLLPAFSKASELLEHIRDDVVRQVNEQAGDLTKARDARRLEDAVEKILASSKDPDVDVWEDDVREIEAKVNRKISPSTGQVTEYEYRLVTILPLIERSAGTDEDQLTSRLRSWLNALPAIRADVNLADIPSCVPIETMEQQGAGLRWEPDVELVDDPQDRELRRAFKVPPGVIWYPVASSDETTGPWVRSPAVVSRNADVMTWVDTVLGARRLDDGSFPAELTMNAADAERHAWSVDELHSFDDARRAMENVKYAAFSDLHDEYAYRGLDIRPVWLVRREHGRRGKDAIVVLDSDASETVLGVLRPVQRYVRSTGIDRAEALHQRLAVEKDRDEWGYALVRKGNALQPVAVTPPIIELLAADDHEYDDGREFVLCDGNHRVVNSVWNNKRKMAAIAVVSEPSHPYYAHPFGTYEWHCTSGNVVNHAIENRFKYNARVVNRQDLSPEARERLRGLSDSMLYRRYFRDLSTGFGFLGGQGGAY